MPSEVPQSNGVPALDRIGGGLSAGVLAATGLGMVGALLGVDFPRPDLVAVGAIWAIAFGVAGSSARAAGGGGVVLVTIAAHGAAVAAAAAWFAFRPVEGAVPWHRLALLGLGPVLLLRLMRGEAVAAGARPGTEDLRLVALVLLVPACTWAYLTPQFVGGVDAKWYGYVLADQIQQSRAGVFPVWVGQGDYMFNGAVHPFRTAPAYSQFGALLDLAFGRTAGVFAVQHAVVVAAFASSLGLAYWGLVRAADGRRGLAFLGAVALATSPGLFGLVSVQEMYMSYVATPALAAAAAALLRALVTASWRSHLALGVALAALWYCHSPIALWTGGAALGALALRAALDPRGGDRVRGLGLAIGTLAWLSWFHFRNLGDFTAPGTVAGVLAGWPLGAALGAVLAAGRAIALRSRVWLGGAVAVAAVATAGAPTLSAGLGPVLGLAAFVVWRVPRAAAWPETAWIAGIPLTLLAWSAARAATAAEAGPAAADMARFTAHFWPEMLRPVGARFSLADVQPGYAVLLLGLGLVGVAFARARNGTAAGSPLPVVAAVVCAFALLLLPLPVVGAHLWSLLPTEILVATSGVPNLRLTPAWVAVMVFGGTAALAGAARPFRRAGGVLLAVSVVWAVAQVQVLNRRLAELELSPLLSADVLRTELAPLGIYPFNFLLTPPRFSHGVMDVRDETRLLESDEVTPQPDPVPAPDAPLAVATLRMRRDPAVPWLRSDETIRLAPGERRRLVFDFRAEDLDGVLILSGPRFYREYLLPRSGGPEAFGAEPGNSRAVPLWNSLEEPVEFEVFWATSRPVAEAGLEFARIELHGVPGRPAVTVERLVPLTVTVEAARPGMLETPRRHLAGYRATVDGRAVRPEQTLAGQLGVPVPAGRSVVEVRFEGTPGARRALAVSGVGWLAALGALGAAGARNLWRRRRT